jgi:hypothetical protein
MDLFHQPEMQNKTKQKNDADDVNIFRFSIITVVNRVFEHRFPQAAHGKTMKKNNL